MLFVLADFLVAVFVVFLLYGTFFALVDYLIHQSPFLS